MGSALAVAEEKSQKANRAIAAAVGGCASERDLALLFAGPVGTGKTMAAEVIARELGVELYRIDLGAVVSEHIGETEKNLDRIFDTATSAGAVLLFDEADALFARRSEIRDAHDRYANIEVAYLLQKLEEHQGVVIFTTNRRHNLDDAFLRRLRFVVDFPLSEPSAVCVLRRGSSAPFAASRTRGPRSGGCARG